MNIFRKMVTFIADIFPKLQTPKNVVKIISKKSPFRGSFHKQHSKTTKHCWTLNGATFTIYIDHCENNWVGKYLIVISKFLRLFLNTLTADGRYSLLNRDNLRKPIKLPLSQKQKIFYPLVSSFLKSRLKVEVFQ